MGKPSFHLFNRSLFLSVSLICLSQFNFGFDQTAYSTTQAMDGFIRRFGEPEADTGKFVIDTNFLALLNSIPYVGFVIGLIVGSHISSRFGRRMVMFVMSLWALITAAITVSSFSRAQILVARTLNYGYVGMELAVVPVFQAEIVPKQIRGSVVETYQLMLFFGGLIMSIICYGTSSTLQGDAQFRVPFGLFFVIPAIVASLIWFIPESPRWLLLHGRNEEAYTALRKLRAHHFSDEDVRLELDATASIIRETHIQGTFFDIFKGANLKRTMITCGVNFFLQITGNTFANKYGTVFIKGLGTVDPFVLTIVNQLVSLTGVVVSMLLIDRIGRRNMIFFGSFFQIGSLFTMGGLGTTSNDPPRAYKLGIIASLSIFSFGFSSGWAPVSHILTAEIPSNQVRDMTYRTASAVNIIIQFVTTFITPYLLNAPYANLGSKVGFVFGSTCVAAVVFAFFCVPDCTGKTLEEIDRRFIDGVPVRKFGSTRLTMERTGDEDVEITKTGGGMEEKVEVV